MLYTSFLVVCNGLFDAMVESRKTVDQESTEFYAIQVKTGNITFSFKTEAEFIAVLSQGDVE